MVEWEETLGESLVEIAELLRRWSDGRECALVPVRVLEQAFVYLTGRVETC